MAKRRRTQQAGNNRRRTSGSQLSRMSVETLLDMRMCDLDLSLAGTMVERCIERLYVELDRRDIVHKPHTWMSSEWFSPDGVPGIAVPFYLAHPRLAQLEKRMMLEVEGGTERTCMKILRHEAGHTVCNAYRLHYRHDWRKTFGKYSEPYPDSYKPRPDSRDYVLHLGSWYAQVHPAEDFAETFAVWLRPNSRWRKQYHGWPALRKLEYVDRLMKEIAGEPPRVRTRRHVEPLREIRTTLREHYREKRFRFGEEWPEFYDRDLQRLFSNDPQYRSRPSAAQFLRRTSPRIRETVALWTGTYQYTIDQVLQDMIDRCRELNLRLTMNESETTTQAIVMVTVQTMNYIHGGHDRIAI